MMKSETLPPPDNESGWLKLLPHIGSMRNVYRFYNTKRSTKFARASSGFL
ncbi:hypothetical protein SAMN05216338_100596 [Bradyrhizobium sp. Rc2d]|nr:hypothetical protein SAMN05216338_100596 [Bradyrhizobium sp. Rc2d]